MSTIRSHIQGQNKGSFDLICGGPAASVLAQMKAEARQQSLCSTHGAHCLCCDGFLKFVMHCLCLSCHFLCPARRLKRSCALSLV